MSSKQFEPLQQSAFLELSHSASLKGLLKVRENQQDLEEWAKACEGMRDQLISMSQSKILRQVRTFPFSLLPVQLAQQTTGSGTAFLRWRKVDRSAMGVYLWEELILSQSTPDHLINDLYRIELQRIVLNMQISLLHSIAKQSYDCAKKMASAESVLQQRLNLENQ